MTFGLVKIPHLKEGDEAGASVSEQLQLGLVGEGQVAVVAHHDDRQPDLDKYVIHFIYDRSKDLLFSALPLELYSCRFHLKICH